ncbi:hypothetical protein [Streptomyces sp. NBC_01092]|uniref:DUF7848 domain-containing protein n=1 Tax=Streptomyces sp. NBC_01092 TaxID=2903748 RepID=UPI00386AAC83|nr:hypothetical protein OG254_42955 [Streptomyces sp. NBC_01092]
MDYKINRDPIGEVTWAAVCVSGEEEECGASSGDLGAEKAANLWMAVHRAGTGHNRFKRSVTDYVLVEPKS